jgi:hypothetical protein
MLYMSLLFSVAVLLVANLVARKSGHLGLPCVLCGMSVLCVLSPAVMLTGVLTAVSGILCHFLGGGPRWFWKCSLASLVASYLLIGIGSWHRVQEQRALREQYRAESLAQRLSYETPQSSSRPALPPPKEGTPASKAVHDLENRIEDSSWSRTHSLRWLHEQAVADFINSPGFGISRGVRPRREYIELPEVESITLPQPAEEPSFTVATAGPVTSPADALAIVPAEEALRQMHQASVIDFVNAQGFGFIKDREHVTGFQAHHFRAVPQVQSPVATERWRIQSLELVSLLKHAEPVAYLSKHLPRMDELRDAPTRPLRSFEKQALAALYQGEELRLETTANRMDMLGAIRALKACLACHQVQRGDLLGAFSYTLLREPTQP